EILFNPPPKGVDFVEIYNASNKYIDLKNWSLSNADATGLRNIRKITTNTMIIPPQSLMVFTPDIAALQTQYPNRSSESWRTVTLPPFNDDKGSVVLLDNKDRIVQRLDYNEKMHFPLLDDKEGVSLERISYKAPVNDANNWASASSESGFGTPGYPNSQNVDNPLAQLGNECFRIEPEAFSPDGDGYKDFTTIVYGCNSGNKIANILIYDAMGREVRNFRQNTTLSNEGFFKWDGTNDSGQKVRVGLYVVYIQVFDLNGNIQEYQLPVAVGGRF
ncbi:MAG: lamin tail domain-containing protein, partial [Flammeovirgaceae bacterium]|nr:lamin tail domain-containing protein [Flammeovirgaceae bacterium]MDW8287457.1 lamin tail domain-containing protein [Flammeovirgaceae bacterium]